MLGKLLKYEMKSTSRVMWFLYAAVIIVGAVLGIAIRVNINIDELNQSFSPVFASVFGLPQILLIVFALIYGLLLLAMAVMTIIMIIIRFNSNLLKGEGYLMHTLPVPTWMLVLSKTIISLIWMIIGSAAAIISALLLGLTSGMLPLIIKEGGLKHLWKLIAETIGSNNLWLFLIAALVSSIALILQFYFSMAVGNIANRNKFLLAVAVFIGVQIVVTIITAVTGNSLFDALSREIRFNSILIQDLILNAVFAAVFFFGTTLILKKRLNLA